MTSAAGYTPRERLTGALDALSDAFAALDEVGPLLPPLERDAALLLRDDVSAARRQLTNLIAFLPREAA